MREWELDLPRRTVQISYGVGNAFPYFAHTVRKTAHHRSPQLSNLDESKGGAGADMPLLPLKRQNKHTDRRVPLQKTFCEKYAFFWKD